jgi:CRP-like cAMP-binding protein
MTLVLLSQHAQRASIVRKLKTNIVLRALPDSDLELLAQHVSVTDHKKGDVLLTQGAHDMEQYFIVEGVLKRVVANPEGKEMIIRFAKEDDMDTSYAAWRLRTPAPYSIVAVTQARVVRMPLPAWAEFLEARPDLKSDFEYEIMHLMSEVMAHTITLHLLDAPGRLMRFMRKYPDMLDRVPKKELASHLNLSAETLSRLKHSERVQAFQKHRE